MSELKAFDITVAEEGYCEGIVKYRRAVYDKSEADKVIAELKEGAKNLILDNYLQDKEIRHQKYKRCLAMASRCFSKSNYHFVLARHGEDGKENNRKSILYSKWHKRWLAIAEQFKEAK